MTGLISTFALILGGLSNGAALPFALYLAAMALICGHTARILIKKLHIEKQSLVNIMAVIGLALGYIRLIRLLALLFLNVS
jgi:hypothetical protein